MAYKKAIAFSGDLNLSKEQLIEYARACINRARSGHVAAMHDVFYIVNQAGIPLDSIVEDPVKIAEHPYYIRLETLV